MANVKIKFVRHQHTFKADLGVQIPEIKPAGSKLQMVWYDEWQEFLTKK